MLLETNVTQNFLSETCFLSLIPIPLGISFLIPDNSQYKHKVFFMMHKCSLSHLKTRRNENQENQENTKNYYKFMQKPSFNFIKCRNFYVFLINVRFCGNNVVAFVIILMKTEAKERKSTSQS